MAGTLCTLAIDRFPLRLSGHAPNVARFYDVLLSGKDNYVADRVLARKVETLAPAMRGLFRHNRRFAAQAVHHMVNQGVTQFLDLGCGLPTVDNAHQVAQRRNPRARVVYVDHDPIVVAHGGARLADHARTAVVGADIRDLDAVLGADETRQLLDLSRPVGVLLTSVLPHIHDGDDPHGIVRSYMDRLPSGSMLALSHFHTPQTGKLRVQARRVEQLLLAELGSGRFRSEQAIAAFFDGLIIDGHGLRSLLRWGPGEPAETDCLRHSPSLALCGVARKP